MLFGALKNNSSYGYASVLLLILIPFLIIFLPLKETLYAFSDMILQSFTSSIFINLNQTIAKIFNISEFKLTSIVGVKIQVFLAFAYTYHYLNWFSKTNIIGWREDLSNQKILVIILIWIGAVSLYLYDYRTGLTALFFLSILHVFLELPLNVISIKASYQMIKKKIIH